MLHRTKFASLRVHLCRPHQKFVLTVLTVAAALLGARALWCAPRAAAFATIQNSVQVVTASAASYVSFPSPLAPNSIAAAFGTQLSSGIASAPSVPLPTTLNNTTVTVDGIAAPLFFVSPGQINYLIPPNVSAGEKQVVVTAQIGADTVVSRGRVLIGATSPAIFAANSNGTGAAAALTGRINAGGQFVFDSNLPFEVDPLQPNRFVPAPIDVGTAERPAFLILYGTGLRNAPGGSVRAIVGGVDIPVTPVAHPFFIGLDQVNVQIPLSLAGRGFVDVTLVVGGVSSNTVTVNMAGAAGAGLSVSSFNAPAEGVLAGQTLTITGTGFSTTPSNNIVRFGGVQGRVVAATSTQLSVIVPFGAESSRVTVQNTQGEARSATALRVRTSVSGIVQSTGVGGTPPVPLEGVTVRLAGSSLSVRTNRQGTFVLSGINPGAALVEIDGGTVTAAPPYPRVALKIVVNPDRDNLFAQPISMQQITGSSTTVGGGGVGQAPSASRAAFSKAAFSQPRLNVTITNRGVSLDIPLGTSVRFSDGKSSGQVQLTVVEKSRLPGIQLPVGVYSSTIAQITPFGATFAPGASLSFPNPDPANLTAGAKVDLYRYDPPAGAFIKRGTGTVVAGTPSRVVSDGRVVDLASFWFAAVPTGVTTVVGRVIDSFSFPVPGAQVSVNGRSDTTDQNGGFSIPDVATAGATTLQVEAVVPQQYGTPPRGTSAITSIVVGGVTNVGNIALSDTNQAALVLSPFSLDLASNAQPTPLAVTLTQPAPAGNLVITLASDDTSVVTVPANVTIPAGQTTVSFNVTRAGPGVAFITATATLGGQALESEAVVTVARAAPTLTGVTPTSAPVGAPIVISGTGFSPIAEDNYIAFVDPGKGTLLALVGPDEVFPDEQGRLAIALIVPPLAAGRVGIVAAVADEVTGVISDASAPINFTITPSNVAAPQLTQVSPSSGKPRDQVTITGSGFSTLEEENIVTFRQDGRDTEAFVLQASASQLVVAVPARDIVKGLAAIFVQRIAPDGAESGPSNALSFQVTEDPAPPTTPTLSSVVHAQTGAASGRDGDTVRATGTGFGKNFLDPEEELGNDEPLITLLAFYQNGELINLAFANSASGGTQITAIIPTGLKAGTAQITAATFDLESGLLAESAPLNFTITVTSLLRIDEDEPNDAPEIATLVEIPVIVDGAAAETDPGEITISYTGGPTKSIQDLFLLSLDSTTMIRLDLQFLQGGDLDLFIIQERPDGSLSLVDSSTLPTGTTESISRSLSAGDYLIGVLAFSGATPYQLTVNESQSAIAGSAAQAAGSRYPVGVERKGIKPRARGVRRQAAGKRR